MGEGTGSAELAALLALTGDTFLVLREGRIVLATGVPVLGYEPGDVVGHHLAEFAHPDDVPVALEFIERLRAGIPLATGILCRARSADGEWVLTRLEVFDHNDDPVLLGTVVRLHVVKEDADEAGNPREPPLPTYEMPSATDHSGESTGALASLAEVVPAGILATDLQGFVVFANAVAREMLGGPIDQLSGDGWRDVVHPDDITDVVNASAAALEGERTELLFRVVLRDDQRWILGRFAPLRPLGRITGLVSAFDDVTVQREAEAALAHQATHDALTGLPNRLLLRDRLSQALSRLGRAQEPVSVLFLDLDGFKEINDERGHGAGDKVLAEVARRLLLAVRPTDTVARFGGDEFVVVCEGLDTHEARELATRLVEVISQNLTLSGTAVHVAVSIGVAVVHRPSTVDEALHRADAAMYRAKQNPDLALEVSVVA
jgi:diguanylate cyclase (GGDEF)-like protein/PAS domain S-box-containing protein